MTTILIEATGFNRQVTVEDIQALTSYAALSYMRDVVRDCASQIGRDACKAAFEELDRAETRLFGKGA